MERQSLNLTKQEALDLVWEGSNEVFEVISDTIISHSRWGVNHKIIIKRISDNKFFSDIYSKGATEDKDEAPFEHREPNFREVFPVEKMITVYE